MTDKKLTDNEIIKALECCSEENKNIIRLADKTIETANAEIEELVGNNDKLNIELQSMRSAANSLKMHYEEAQAEIERLKDNLNIELDNFASEYDDKIKAEAYKECLAKVKNYIKTHCNPYGKPDFDYDTSIKILNFIDSFAQEI